MVGEYSPELKTAISRVQIAAAAAQKKSGIYCTSGEQARMYADQGFNMVRSIVEHPMPGEGRVDS